MKPTKHELEAITVRRAKVADGGKVRYRVYNSPSEFVAVIADSALMAVKVSGISKPYKIMRDLPTDTVAIEAAKMVPPEANAEQVMFAVGQIEKPEQYFTDLPPQDEAAAPGFVPLDIADLKRRGNTPLRILSPDMVNQIIEEHARQLASQAEPPAPPPAPPPVVAPAPEPEVPHETVLITPAEPQLSPEEKIAQLADEVFRHEPAEAAPADTSTLSPEEVEKLLNG